MGAMKKHPSVYALKRKKIESRLIRVMIGLLFMFAAFIAGFLVRGDTDFLNRMGFETGVQGIDSNPGMTVSGSTYDSLSARIAEAQGILEQHSVDDYDLEATTDEVISVIAENTNDPFVSYLNDEQYDAYISASRETYKGIGVLFSENKGEAFAIDVFAGSQAEADGIQPGDYVVSISGNKGPNGKWTQADVLKAIETAGDGVLYITWRRPASLDARGGEEFSTELRVSDYEEPNVETEIDDAGVGYIKLSQISSNSASLMAGAVKGLQEQGAKAFVLDIRNNPGGYLSQALDIGTLFVENGTFVEVSTKDSTFTKEVGGKTATDAPLVVIINGHTSAAAEVLAGGLRDNDRCTLVGETTMGKGSVQSVSGFSFGGGIRYTSAYYRTPKGYDIEGVGISPDAGVDAGDSAEGDAQKEFAMEMAASSIEQQ